MEKILTVNDVAAVLQVKAITVREMFREKRLRGFKVGKSWRTTETMLQEDINALARGEAPAELPGPATPPATSRPPARTTPPPAAPRPEPAPAPARPARKAPATPPRDAEEGGEDTQQLLF